MYSFQRIPTSSTYLNEGVVPTDQQRQGDFSQTFDGLGKLNVIFDPSTTAPAGNGKYVRQPFAGNRIPQNRFDSSGIS